MPCLNVQITSDGPLVQVYIGLSLPRAKAMSLAGKAVPQPVKGVFLVDTGASGTCVDPDLVASLGLPIISTTQIHTPSTQGNSHPCNLYDASIMIASSSPGRPPLAIQSMPILETRLRPQGIDGLLGRDVLDQCTLVYNGSIALLTLAY